MKHLLLFISCIFLLSCNNPTSPDSKYPYLVGTWQVNSETQAEWVGKKARSKSVQQADTIHIEQPGKRGLTIFQEPSDDIGDFELEFVDSTITTSSPLFEKYDGFRIDIRPISGFGVGSGGFLATPDRLVLTAGIGVVCHADLPDRQNMFAQFYDSTKTPLRTYRFDVDGLSEAALEIACN